MKRPIMDYKSDFSSASPSLIHPPHHLKSLFLHLILTTGIFFLIPTLLRGQQVCTHSVTVKVLMTNGASLYCSDNGPSSDDFTQKGSGSIHLSWRFDRDPKKIVISQHRISRPMKFKIKEVNSDGGSHAVTRRIQLNDQNVVAFIPKKEGECLLNCDRDDSSEQDSHERSDALTWTILDM